MTRILLIRHVTNDTVGKLLAGRRAGVLLNQEGKQQAERLALVLAGKNLKAIYTSPLERAIETGLPLANKIGLELKINNDFLEIDFGDWTFCAFEQLANDPIFEKFNTFRSGTRIPGGEMMAEAQLRMVTAIHKLCLIHPKECIAIISHADMIKATIAYYAGIPLDLFHRLEIGPCTISDIEIEPGTGHVRIHSTNQQVP